MYYIFPLSMANSSSCYCLPVAYIACRLHSVCRPIPRIIVLCFHHIFSQMCKNTFLMRKIIKSINSRYVWHSQVVKITILNGLRKLWHYIYFKQFKNSYVQITLSMANSSSCYCLPVAYFFLVRGLVSRRAAEPCAGSRFTISMPGP